VPDEIIEEEAPVENDPLELDDLDNLDDLNDDPNEGRSDMESWCFASINCLQPLIDLLISNS
jgi:hypothetical protein